MLYYEDKYNRLGYKFVIGVDEAGRGPLAGPVVSAAVLLNRRRFNNLIDDSKKLAPLAREKAFLEINRNSVNGIGIVNEKIIDRINILEATRLSMQQAVISLVNKLGNINHDEVFVIADGNMDLCLGFPYQSIIKGDNKSKSIAAASILAKVIRDRMMYAYDKIYPAYGFKRHKGYPTKEHRGILREIGPCVIHRKSFVCA
ncbi:MAG: ribonuclease HII [Candidatus Omnitrophica bacterium]|jgi:ribonuclease HII|nr:ribonuclease HII [Candidatus Omnitrophota bacterium]MDD3987428.1 ribonuclease HII [Candidatus Omnitrophota bacterium]MDD4981295.1 ribonuclease HII [Candidatus Omnitrophota bacterium]MDD5664582.1 ribonuclease HII [Candidatus Omnitrophota bacterium]